MKIKIKGRVYDARTDESLVGASVYAEYRRGEHVDYLHTGTDINGEYILLFPATADPRVPVIVTAHYVGYQSLTTHMPVDREGTRELQLPMLALHDVGSK